MPPTAPVLDLQHTFAERLTGLYEPWRAEPLSRPRLLLANDELATELGVDPALLRTDAGLRALVGADLPEDARPVAQAYSGHQFGGFSPRLGDGRALLLGEVVDVSGRRRDIHLKGSGRTPFSRGGDGRAAVGPVLREYVMGEAMHALGVPTTRALAAVATGELVQRDRELPGAVLVRVAASHLRVGTFQYAAVQGDRDLVSRLVDYAIERHHPGAADAPNRVLGLLDAVVTVQAELLARWMHIGFIHGVMNTDNMTISGETIDYGPCAFMDRFEPTTVFSSIDHAGRYAYGNQPVVAQWNLARFAETLLPLVDDDADTAVAAGTAAVERFADRYTSAWTAGMCTKLGVGRPADPCDPEDALVRLATAVPALLRSAAVDLTSFFRALARAVRGDDGPVRSLFADPAASEEWAADWWAALERSRAERGLTAEQVADGMDSVNPRYVPRNHLVEAALTAAVDRDDLGPVTELLEVVTDPFTERPGRERFAGPAPDDFGPYRTFCGT
jgi:serine/tyrosine/threonine adenylyltransferase